MVYLTAIPADRVRCTNLNRSHAARCWCCSRPSYIDHRICYPHTESAWFTVVLVAFFSYIHTAAVQIEGSLRSKWSISIQASTAVKMSQRHFGRGAFCLSFASSLLSLPSCLSLRFLALPIVKTSLSSYGNPSISSRLHQILRYYRGNFDILQQKQHAHCPKAYTTPRRWI